MCRRIRPSATPSDRSVIKHSTCEESGRRTGMATIVKRLHGPSFPSSPDWPGRVAPGIDVVTRRGPVRTLETLQWHALNRAWPKRHASAHSLFDGRKIGFRLVSKATIVHTRPWLVFGVHAVLYVSLTLPLILLGLIYVAIWRSKAW